MTFDFFIQVKLPFYNNSKTMNILIPHSWLLEHLATDADPTDLQRMVSLCGPSIERIYDRENESVYDIEITTNRVDSMCVRGVAREAAVILEQFGVTAHLKPLSTPSLSTLAPTEDQLPLPKISIETPNCKRILCVLLDGIEHTSTPDWMAKRLRQTEQQIHDSVIDITNYITHELGYPCHAFDYDKLMQLGGEIHVVEAKPDHSFTTLDGVSHKTVGGEIVFINQHDEIIDLPAVMGTANSSVDEKTKRVLLWIESLDAKKVRFTSMTHAIRTVAAQLEEKGADPVTAELVLARGAELYQELCHAKIASSVFDQYPVPQQLQPVNIEHETITRYLGIALPINQITTILERLGCAVGVNGETLVVTPPSYRPDITIPADVVEEIARIYGYQNLPSTIMPGSIPLTKQVGVNFLAERQIKERLAALGWQELYTYSMVGKQEAIASGYDLEQHLQLANPLTDDKIYLRRSLVPSLLQVAQNNDSTKKISHKLFEIANLYHPQEKQLPIEALTLTLVTNVSLIELKTNLTELLQLFHLNLPTMSQSDEKSARFGELISITSHGQGWFSATIDMATLISQVKTHPAYQPIPRYPAVIEDLTFTVPPKVGLGAILAHIQAQDSLIESVTLGSQYRRNSTYTITFRAKDTALSAADIAPIRAKIVQTVAASFGAQLVGNLT